jgi:hypothetical protein
LADNVPLALAIPVACIVTPKAPMSFLDTRRPVADLSVLPLFPAMLSGVALLYAALFGYFIWATAGQMSGYDFLDWIMHYGERPAGWLAYLWAPHSEHRIAAERLLLVIDIEWFGGTGVPFVVVRTALLLILILGLAWQIRNSQTSPLLKATALSLLVFALLPAQLVVMCTMPVMGGFVHTCSFAVFALLLWDNDSTPKRAAAIAAAAIAGFGLAGGLFTWPVLAFVAWRSGARGAWLAVIGVAGLVMWAIYLKGLPSHRGLPAIDLQRLVAMADFVLRFLGLPWSHSAALVWPGRVIGALVLAIGCHLLLTDAFSGQLKPGFERIGLGMILFAFLLAATASLARLDTAPDREMPVRYGMIVALAHAGILLAALPWIGRLIEGRRAAAAKAAIVLAAAALLAQQVMVGRAAMFQAGLYSDAWQRFSAGAWTPDMTHFVYPDRARAEKILAYMKAAHIYGQ